MRPAVVLAGLSATVLAAGCGGDGDARRLDATDVVAETTAVVRDDEGERRLTVPVHNGAHDQARFEGTLRIDPDGNASACPYLDNDDLSYLLVLPPSVHAVVRDGRIVLVNEGLDPQELPEAEDGQAVVLAGSLAPEPQASDTSGCAFGDGVLYAGFPAR